MSTNDTKRPCADCQRLTTFVCDDCGKVACLAHHWASDEGKVLCVKCFVRMQKRLEREEDRKLLGDE